MNRLLFCLILIAACNRPPTTHTSDLAADSLIDRIRTELARKYNDKDVRYAQQYLDSLWPGIRKMNHPASTSAWYSYKARTFLTYDNDSARPLLDTALYWANISGSPKAKVIAKMQLISLLYGRQQLDSALKHALEALELAKVDPPLDVPLLYAQLAHLYRAADDSANYRRYLFEGLKISKDPMHIAAFSSDIGRYYNNEYKSDSAAAFFKNFQQFNEFSNHYLEARKKEDLSRMLFSKGKLKEGIESMKLAIALYKKDGFEKCWNFLRIGIESSELGLLNQAGAYLDTALAIARKENDIENVSNTLFFQSTVLIKQKRYAEAYSLLDSSYTYHLSYDTIAFRNHAKKIENKLLDDLKDQKISSMTMEMLATKKISNQRLLIIVTLSMLGLIVVVLGYLLVRRRKVQTQLKEVQLEQQALRSQMQPHFIFNSLGALQSYIRSGEKDMAIDFLDRFSRLLRLSLENARKNAVPLKDEVTALEHYLTLQSSQLDDCFDYFVETYEGYEQDLIMIPPMLLQPFVENAVLHGFNSLKERGWVTVKISREGHLLRCIIEDNGVGLGDHPGKNTKRSLSTTITKERLDLLSKQTGKKASLEIIDKARTKMGSGVRVILYIPFFASNSSHV